MSMARHTNSFCAVAASSENAYSFPFVAQWLSTTIGSNSDIRYDSTGDCEHISLRKVVHKDAKHRYVVFVKRLYVLVCASFVPRKDAAAVAIALFAVTL